MQTIPVKINDVIDVTIEKYASKGDGLAQFKGFVIMIKNTEIGKKYKIKIYKVMDKYAFGEIMQNLKGE